MVRLLMLYDRIKWHYDPNTPWQDEDAVRALIPAGRRRLVSDASSGFRYDLTDHAEFQLPDPEWVPPPGLRGMVVRVGDGVYREPVFSTHFRRMDDLLQQGLLDYVMWYILPNPNVSNQRMIDAIAAQIRESGVTWGRRGHGFSIDDEPTPYHAQLTGQTMVDFRNALQDIYQLEELHYVGLYNGNYGFIADHGWKLWAPWPTSNGALPSWTTNLVMQQWGVASPGEVPGFPNKPVDVNHLFDVATLDELTGRNHEEDDLTPDEKAMLAEVHNAITGKTSEGDPRWVVEEARITDTWHKMGDVHNAITGKTSEGDPRWVVEEARITDTWHMAATILGTVSALSAPTVDVDALAKALAPLLNSGTDAHAVALEVADVLGDRLSTGGTPGGGQ